jgi:acetyl-CoA carboxylase biotin carboxyl carrier protein
MRPKDTEIVRLIGEPRTCLVRESGDKDGHFDILAPGVGLFDMPPATGAFLMPGSFVGYLTVMRRYFHLLMPEGHHGVVTRLHVTDRKQRVEYGQALFTVSARAEAGLATEFKKIEADAGLADEGVPDGMFGVRSPTDGIFYRRPNPQSPPYVEEGAIVEQGSVLALVEVMKCFNPIVYPGEPEFPPRARVVESRVKDSAEVKHGSLIFIIEPTN